MPIIAIALLFAAALGGGTAAAAQGSLPGDALWGFKVHINENVQAALAQSAAARADWNISAINTRLDEAEALAAKGQLSANAQAEIDANLAMHEQAVASIVAKLQAAGDSAAATDVTAHYQSAIAAHVDSLAQVDATLGVDAQASLSPIVTKVRTALDAATNLSAHTNANVTTGVNVGL